MIKTQHKIWISFLVLLVLERCINLYQFEGMTY